MTENVFDVFLHRDGEDPCVARAKTGETLENFLARAGITAGGDDEVFVFVGECEEALRAPDDEEDGEDGHEPEPPDKTVDAVDLRHRRHIHCHRCRRVGVEVHFSGRTVRRKVSPATTVGVITEWARRRFRLDPESAAEYVLQICESDKQPRTDEHVGELVTAPECAVCFDLVKEMTPQG